jgi:GMP synthase (glutamine-hydrolysing)
LSFDERTKLNEQAVSGNGGAMAAGATAAVIVPKAERGGIVVLDFGGQYTQLIARRIREQQVFSSILPCTASLQEIRALAPVGVVLSGGPSSVYDAGAPKCDPGVLNLDVPVLGICYGLQWIVHTLGGEVSRAGKREYGRMILDVEDTSGLLTGFPKTLNTWNNHGDHVLSLPKGFRITGRTDNAISAAENSERQIYAVQFHPEVKHTERGTDILRNFVFRSSRKQLNPSARKLATIA